MTVCQTAPFGTIGKNTASRLYLSQLSCGHNVGLGSISFSAEPSNESFRRMMQEAGAAQSGRAGVIEEVLAQDPPRFRVLWDDGRTSIFAPSAGVTRIERHKSAREGLTDWEAARRYHECTG